MSVSSMPFLKPRIPVHPAIPPPRLPPAARRAAITPWSPPLRPRRLPVYDEALKYIRADAAALRAELADLKHAFATQAAERARAGLSHDEHALTIYKQKKNLLEVQSQINLPEVRAAFRSGRFPFAKPVYRHLTEQKWRNNGTLDLLMERMHQMHVIPDLLPSLHPSIDVRVQFRTPDATPATIHTRGFIPVEPGTFLLPAQTLAPPRVSATAFHLEERLYTMILLDPDVPDEASRSFKTYVHWLQPNIPISGTRRITLIPPSESPALSYIPPHPQRGTQYHRYVLLLLPHASSTPLPPTLAEIPRLGFDLRQFCGQYGIDCSQGGGAHMWREVWDETVSEVYRGILATPEPRYGRPRKPDRFASRSGGDVTPVIINA